MQAYSIGVKSKGLLFVHKQNFKKMFPVTLTIIFVWVSMTGSHVPVMQFVLNISTLPNLNFHLFFLSLESYVLN